MKIDPIHQFEIKELFVIEIFGRSFNLTNSAISLCLAFFVIFLLGSSLNNAKKKSPLPTFLNYCTEYLYNFVKKLTTDNITEDHEAKRYFPFILSIFLFILICNLLGLMPYGFTATSHIAVNFVLSIIVFLITLIISIKKHGIFLHRAFIPHGTPGWLCPLIFILEFFSYLAKPVSLAVRLASNMMAGHVMLDVMAVFTIAMKFFGFVPFLALSVLIGFEFFVAFLQSYIFAVFSCVYINQAVHH